MCQGWAESKQTNILKLQAPVPLSFFLKMFGNGWAMLKHICFFASLLNSIYVLAILRLAAVDINGNVWCPEPIPEHKADHSIVGEENWRSRSINKWKIIATSSQRPKRQPAIIQNEAGRPSRPWIRGKIWSSSNKQISRHSISVHRFRSKLLFQSDIPSHPFCNQHCANIVPFSYSTK